MKLSKAKAALDKTLKVSSKDVKLSGSLSQLFFNARKGQTVLCGIAASDEGNKALTSTELTALTIGGRPSEPKLMPHAKGLLTHGLSSASSLHNVHNFLMVLRRMSSEDYAHIVFVIICLCFLLLCIVMHTKTRNAALIYGCCPVIHAHKYQNVSHSDCQGFIYIPLLLRDPIGRLLGDLSQVGNERLGLVATSWALRPLRQ